MIWPTPCPGTDHIVAYCVYPQASIVHHIIRPASTITKILASGAIMVRCKGSGKDFTVASY